MNPILPLQYFVPDPEARQWEDGRMYIYGSCDISGNTDYCSHYYHVFSSDNLINWVNHGVSFRSAGSDSGVPWSDQNLYAPDCIYYNGKYYLFFCLSDNGEGVATSLSPYGPFKNAMPVEGAHGDAIDPAVFIDDDGKAYYYWGQQRARGARLKPDLSGIEPETLNPELINEEEHGFHEGASIRKRNGIYYLLYTDISRGKASCISYAMGRSPLGPFTKGGVIIDNDGCDPENWNNHGSLAEFNGQWYIFYHRASHGSKFSRRVCIEPVRFNEDGSIPEVEMTTSGVSGPLKAASRIEAYRACLLSGKVRTEDLELCKKDNGFEEHLAFIEHNDWAAYKYIDFAGGVSKFEVNAASLTLGGNIEVRVDSINGPLLGVCSVSHTGGWKKWGNFQCSVKHIAGIHVVYLIFKGRQGRLFNIKDFLFSVSEEG